MMMVKQQGFSLLELMVTVAIVGILVGIVYPSYVDGLTRSRRAEAMSQIIRVANLQEQYFADNRTYATDMIKLGLAADPYITDNGYYSIDAVAVTAISEDFIITATATGIQAANDSYCTAFMVDNLGQKTAKKSGADNTGECWEHR